MATQVTSLHISPSLHNDKIVCLQHKHEVCTDCGIDWTEQNKLAISMKALNEVPAPNKPIQSVNAQVNRLKVEGNRAYKEENYTEAIEFYTEAVDLAWSRPLWEPLAFQFVREELAPILSNRSAAYALLGNYVNAYVDAEIVTRLKKNWSKGWFRKGKALHGLKRYDEAIIAYRLGRRYDSKNEELINSLREAENCIQHQ